MPDRPSEPPHLSPIFSLDTGTGCRSNLRRILDKLADQLHPRLQLVRYILGTHKLDPVRIVFADHLLEQINLIVLTAEPHYENAAGIP